MWTLRTTGKIHKGTEVRFAMFRLCGSLKEGTTMATKSSQDPQEPRKDTARETREAAAKTPDKTNEQDRDRVHGDGESIGLESGETPQKP
jgi:hypothetical protein